MKFRNYVCFVLILEIRFTNSNINSDLFTSWANRIGEELWRLAENLTKYSELKSMFSGANITELNGKEIIKEMSDRAHIMIELKKSALYRIVNVVEEYSKNLSDTVDRKAMDEYDFEDAKNLKNKTKNQLIKDVNFFNTPVTTDGSTVHIPTDVYSGGNETLLGIKCTKELDHVFKHNYASDPSLSWQYFAGVSGFMRIYPGIEWEESDKADLYDARSRPWYIEAATDPKDIVILVDNSGSMMGQKGKIARQTINTILETLGPNDFVNIFRFVHEAVPVVDCFNNSLVQANLVTIRQLKSGVEKMAKPTNLANFQNALIKAFEVLENHQRDNLASMCNQAIMLITDGVPNSYTKIFEQYNWKNSTDPPFPVRMFTYLIGRDGADFRDTKWMACANQGYYVQLNTMQEVKEQVFNYINVLARPLVLKNSKKIAWTSLYAHKTDPKITDFYWENLQNEQQKENTKEYKTDWRKFLDPIEQNKRAMKRRKIELDQNKNIGDQDKFHFMITVSHPAYDQRKTKNITENILVNEAYWTQRVYEAKVASLLGVAATDIPIEEFKKIMKPFYLGVNNYGFIVNNNGYVIVHPDLRPFFRETLKPGYNSVDMLEVELLDTPDPNKAPRDFDIQVQIINGEATYTLNNLSLLRDLVINQTDSSNNSFMVKYHYEDMRRVATGRRHYYIGRINNSPFTMVLAIMKPNCKENLNCQPSRIMAPHTDDKITMSLKQIDELFSGNWNVHPEWFYCKFNYNNDHYRPWADQKITNKTTELLYFLNEMIKPTFWNELTDPYGNIPADSFSSSGKKPYRTEDRSGRKEMKFFLKSYFCDKELIRNVIYDANVTKRVFQHLDNGYNIPPELNFGTNNILNIFIATHSGLTRWKDLGNETSFGYHHSKSVDEVWYKRAVQQYYVNEKSFVFSIPLSSDFVDVEKVRNLPVTASHALFIREKKKSSVLEAPVAVVGFQFLYNDFERFIKTVIDGARRNVPGNAFLFYVVDNNGYVLAANETQHVGKFFGELQPEVMRSFKECGIFKEIIIYDYQAVCFDDINPFTSGALSTFVDPLKQAHKFIVWTAGTLLWGIVKINVEILITGLTLPFYSQKIFAFSEIYEDEEDPNEHIADFKNATDAPKYSRVKHIVMINRTRAQTCDKKATLYSLEPEKSWDRKPNCTNVISTVRVIPHTNLLLVLLTNVSENTNKKKAMSTDPVRIKTDGFNSPVCYKVSAVLSRRRPSSCSKHAKEEKEIKLCGGGHSISVNVINLIATISVYVGYYLMW